MKLGNESILDNISVGHWEVTENTDIQRIKIIS